MVGPLRALYIRRLRRQVRESVGIDHVTIYVCSADNLLRRGDAEVSFLMDVVEQVVAERLARPDGHWQVHIAGVLDLLPDTTAHALKRAVEATRGCTTGAHITLAIGYGGRQEVVDAEAGLLLERAARGETAAELAASLTVADISGHLYTAGQPDPDLVIRTSGERRLSNFLPWQSAHAAHSARSAPGRRSWLCSRNQVDRGPNSSCSARDAAVSGRRGGGAGRGPVRRAGTGPPTARRRRRRPRAPC